MASRALLCPTRLKTSQWLPLSAVFIKMRADSFSEVTTMSSEPSLFKSPKAEPRWYPLCRKSFPSSSETSTNDFPSTFSNMVSCCGDFSSTWSTWPFEEYKSFHPSLL